MTRSLVGVYPDGVWLVELAPLSDPELVPKAVASALELPEQPNRQLTETLVNALRSKLVLLVLDNCEHLVDVFVPAWRRPSSAAASGCGSSRPAGRGKFASGTAEGEVTLSAGTYIFYTRVENTSPAQDDIDARVITKVMVRDASAPRPTGVSRL